MSDHTWNIGDVVWCDGEACTITAIHADRGLVEYEGPRYRHTGLLADLSWCTTLGHGYLPGRLLSEEQTAVVTQLMDAGLLPAHSSRRPGQVPAAAQHHHLFTALFAPYRLQRDGGVRFWTAVVENHRRGAAPSGEAAVLLAQVQSP